jgi:sugar lactone lactonase YvrE
VVCSNGLGWSPDDRTFYFGESFLYTIFAYDFDLDAGAIAARRVFATVDRAEAFPEGLTVDADGGVWSVHNGAGRVVRYAPTAAPRTRSKCRFHSQRPASSAATTSTSSTSPPRA